jgi:hypothetical protein
LVSNSIIFSSAQVTTVEKNILGVFLVFLVFGTILFSLRVSLKALWIFIQKKRGKLPHGHDGVVVDKNTVALRNIGKMLQESELPSTLPSADPASVVAKIRELCRLLDEKVGPEFTLALLQECGKVSK